MLKALNPPSAKRRQPLERVAGPDERPPHMRRRGIVVAEAFLRLLEMAADDILELLHRNDDIRIE